MFLTFSVFMWKFCGSFHHSWHSPEKSQMSNFMTRNFPESAGFSPFFIFYFAQQFFSSSVYPKLNQEMKGAIKKKMMVSTERNSTEVHKSAEELWWKWLQHECKKIIIYTVITVQIKAPGTNDAINISKSTLKKKKLDYKR